MNIPVTPLNLPAGFCPATYQDIWNGFAAASQVQIPDALSQIVWQSTAPSSQTVSWGKLDALGRPLGIFRFAQGAWLSPHPDVPGKTVWWFSALPDFTTFDGGDGNSLSAISGPMWQQALDGNGNLIAAAFPVAAGTLPSTKVLAIGGTGGEEFHTLVPGEDVPHQHYSLNADTNQTSISGTGKFAAYNNDANNNAGYVISGTTTAPSLAPTTVVGGATPPPNTNGVVAGTITPQGYSAQYQARGHNTMPPYVVGYLLQRTNRLFYVG